MPKHRLKRDAFTSSIEDNRWSVAEFGSIGRLRRFVRTPRATVNPFVIETFPPIPSYSRCFAILSFFI